MTKVRVQVGPNQFAQGTSVDFKPITEPWCEFQLHDGSRLRVKLVVSDVIKLDEARGPEGEPIYVIKSSNVVAVSVPDDLKTPPALPPPAGDKPGGTYL